MSSSISKSKAPTNRPAGSQYFEAAANDCPHGLMIEQAGRVVYANPAFARLVGSTGTAIRGKRFGMK
jgi:PAS domain-containing protein